MIKIAILVVCFLLTIGIMTMFPKLKDILADLFRGGLEKDGLRMLPTAALNFISNILAFVITWAGLFLGAEYLFKNVLKLGNLE